MRKQTKIAAVASAAALLAIGASMTSFAATGVWDQDPDTGDWTFYNNLTDKEVIPGFHLDPKLNDGKYYFVDEVEEVMLRSQPVTWKDKLYFVDSSGARVSNCWKSVPNDGEDPVIFEDANETEPDELYYYVDKHGYVTTSDDGYSLVDAPIATGSTKKGKFMFSEEGYMETGWFKIDDGQWVYCNPEADEENDRVAGQAIVKGWLDLTTVEDLPEELQEYVDDYEYSDPDENGHVWMWFDKNGYSVSGGIPDAIDGVKYSFDSNGILNQKGWVDGSGNRMASGTKGDKDNDYVYYARSTGELASGWYPMDDTWYYFASNKAVGREEASDITVRYIGGNGYVFGNDGKLVINSYVEIHHDGDGYVGQVGSTDCGVATASNAGRSDAYADRFASKNDGMQYLNSDGEMATGTQFSYKFKNEAGTEITVYGFVDAYGKVVRDEVAIVDNKYVYTQHHPYHDYGVDFAILATPQIGDYTFVELSRDTECVKIDESIDEFDANNYKKDEDENYEQGTKIFKQTQIESYTKKGVATDDEDYYVTQLARAEVEGPAGVVDRDVWKEIEKGTWGWVKEFAVAYSRNLKIAVDSDGMIVKKSKLQIEIEDMDGNYRGEVTVNNKGIFLWPEEVEE